MRTMTCGVLKEREVATTVPSSLRSLRATIHLDPRAPARRWRILPTARQALPPPVSERGRRHGHDDFLQHLSDYSSGRSDVFGDRAVDVIVGGDFDRTLGQNGSRIEPSIHAVDGQASFRFAVHEVPEEWIGATIARQ